MKWFFVFENTGKDLKQKDRDWDPDSYKKYTYPDPAEEYGTGTVILIYNFKVMVK
jgi:hypothetical protein